MFLWFSNDDGAPSLFCQRGSPQGCATEGAACLSCAGAWAERTRCEIFFSSFCRVLSTPRPTAFGLDKNIFSFSELRITVQCQSTLMIASQPRRAFARIFFFVDLFPVRPSISSTAYLPAWLESPVYAQSADTLSIGIEMTTMS